MLDFFRRLLASDFMPHGTCYLWDAKVLWLHVVSDSLIALSYYAIPFLLFWFARQRRDLKFRWIFVAFGAFILACGSTHLMSVWTVWHATYRLDGLVKAITALSSVATAVMLVPLVPELVALPSPSQLAALNAALTREIDDRKAAEQDVRTINAELEMRVAERSAELKASQEQLLQSQKMEAIGRLAGGVAHDFNNLLTVISGFNEMLTGRVAGLTDVLDYAKEVRDAARRATELTNQLLAFSRRQLAKPEILDLNEVVVRMEKLLRRLIGEDIELTIFRAPGLGRVEADRGQIEQLILNLAVNARDAMPEGGKLTIETANVELGAEYKDRYFDVPPGPYVQLAVSDTGTGMDLETRRRLFEPFFTTKPQGAGTGLGLAIVYGIVKQNEGDIFVYSEPGQGSTFKIYLPRKSAPADQAETPAARRAPLTGAETVLVVEDEPGVLRLVRSMLEQHGYTVLAASTPEEALEMSASHDGHIDLLLTDIVMPRMSGPELAMQLAAQRPDMRMLYMSGYAESGVVRHGLVEAGTDFIQKPFTAATLIGKVREVLQLGGGNA